MRRALLVFVCILLFLVPVHGVGDQITSLNMEVTVDEYGRSQVKATAVVNFATAPTSFAFPLHSRAGSITASGSGEYKTENRNGVVYAVFTNSAGFTGSQTFTCTYALPCGATSVPDEETPTQEFVMNVIDGGWDYSIGDFSLKMTFAAPVEVQPSWNSAFHGDIIDNSLTISVKGKTLTVKSVQSIIDHETLEMTLTFPDQTFTIVHEAGKTLTVNQILFLVLVLAALIYWFLFLRGHWLSPQRQNYPCSDATAGEIPCQLYGEPADIGGILAHWGNLGYLVIHRRRNGRIMLEKQMDMGNERPRVERRLFEGLFLSGTTCDARSLRFRRVCQKYLPAFRKTWIRRMYRPKAGNPYLLKAIVLGAGLVASLSVFDLLLPSNGFRWFLLPFLTIFGTGLCAAVQWGAGAIYRRGRWLRIACGAVAAALLILLTAFAGQIWLMAGCLVLQILCALVTLFGGRRTQSGEDYVRKLLGLRKFLRKPGKDSQSNQDRSWKDFFRKIFGRQKPVNETAQQIMDNDSQYYYRMLPFAEIMSSGKKFTKQYDHWQKEDCPWMIDDSFRPKNTEDFFSLYENIMSAIRDEPRGTAQTAKRRR